MWSHRLASVSKYGVAGIAAVGLSISSNATNTERKMPINASLEALESRIKKLELKRPKRATVEPGTGVIISLGEALIDFLPRPLQGEVGYLPRCGGAPFNVCLTTARLGAPTAFLSHISSDIFGDKICSLLEKDGVNLDLVKRVPQPTTLAFVDLSSDEPQYAFFFQNAADRTLTAELLPELPAQTEAIHLSMGAITLEADVSNAFRTLLAREKGRIFTSFDPNIRDLMIPDAKKYCAIVEEDIALFDLVKVSKADLEYLYGVADLSKSQLDQIAKKWLGRGPGAVLITQGGDSILAYTASGGSFTVGLTPVKVKDAVGAGDSFMGAMLVALRKRGALVPGALKKISDADLRSDMVFASKVAATTCTREGADPPTAREMGWKNKE